MGDPARPETAAGRVDPARVEEYVETLFAREDRHLLRIREEMAREGLPTIQVPAVTGRFLQVLLRAAGARRVVEVGTLGGYSALWIARALPDDGQLVTLERDPGRSQIATGLLREAGMGDRVEVRTGDARTLLATLGPDGSLDALFLDADKSHLEEYVAQARRLLRPGGVLLVDNALWRGAVLDDRVTDADTEALREATRIVSRDPAWLGTVVPVGDGVLVAVRS